MPGYVKDIRTEVAFDGQAVSVRLRPLIFADLLRLQKDNGEEALLEYSALLPRYVAELSPILDADGERVTVETICEAAFFAPLVGAIMAKHLEVTLAPQSPTSGGRPSG